MAFSLALPNNGQHTKRLRWVWCHLLCHEYGINMYSLLGTLVLSTGQVRHLRFESNVKAHKYIWFYYMKCLIHMISIKVDHLHATT